MSITAVASLAQSAIPSGPGTSAVTPAYGLTFRFTVTIEGGPLADLGAWQACSGLKVEFKHESQRAGGSYIGSRWLPGEVNWGRIVLRRAACAADSARVQQWLQAQAYDWIQHGSSNDPGATGVIDLYDSNGDKVLSWKLTGVRAAAWSVSDLEASTSKVAIETLELVHEGFGVVVGSNPETPQADVPPEELVLKKTVADGIGEVGEVRFRYPPQSLGQEKTTRSLYAVTVPAATNTQGTSASPQHIRRSDDPNTPNVTTYPLTGLVLEGRDVREQIERLTNWATRPQVPTDRTEPATSKLPDLVMTWGQGFVDVPVCLAKLQATYVRFEPDGTPTRAKVSVTLEQREVKQGATVRAGQPAPSGGRARSTANTANPPRPNAAPSRRQRRGARNPTSGGVPGRAVHLLAPGQTLPGLARDAYDEPGAWRALAAANDIDDPLRVRPGATLYLPARSELTR